MIPPTSEPVSGECPIRKRRRIDGHKRRPNLKHGLYTLKTAVTALGSRALPSVRTALGRELREWRGALIADLGGEEAISTAQRALVDLAVRTKLLVDSVDAYLLQLPSLVNRSRRVLFPVVTQRVQLAEQLAKTLERLGLERRTKPVPTLGELLSQTPPRADHDIGPPQRPGEAAGAGAGAFPIDEGATP